MKPKFKFLSSNLIKRIINESYKILTEIGFTVYNKKILDIMDDFGLEINYENSHVKFKSDVIEKTLKSVPSAFKLYDSNEKETHNFINNEIHFTPGSSAINILDFDTKIFTKPTTSDYVNYVKVVEQLPHITSQSTAFIPAYVPEKMSDSYRLFLGLLFGEKPVVTGMFTIESFEVMKNMFLVIRGGNNELNDKPLSIFTCCPVLH